MSGQDVDSTAQQTGSPVSEPAPKKRHIGRWIVLAIVVAVCIFAYTQYRVGVRLVNEIRSDADAITASIDALGAEASALDFDAMHDEVADARDHAQHLLSLLSGWRFDVLSYVPTYGGDVGRARLLLKVGIEAADDVALPVLEKLSSAPLAGLISENGIDGTALYDLVTFLQDEMTIAKDDVTRLKEIDGFAIPQLQEELSPLFESLDEVDTLFDNADEVLASAVSFADSFIGEDNKGLLPTLWPLLKPFVGSDSEAILNGMIPYLERYMSDDQAAQVETLLPYLRALFGVQTESGAAA